jgi:hypothetical protein
MLCKEYKEAVDNKLEESREYDKSI